MNMFIGLTGLIGAGKDTVAAMLYSLLYAFGFRVRVDSFAAPLRDITRHSGIWDGTRERKEAIHQYNERLTETAIKRQVAIFLGMGDQEIELTKRILYWCSAHNWTFSPREFMIQLGNEARDIHPSYWISKLVERAEKYSDPVRDDGYPERLLTIISDVRFPNETRILGARVLIVRPSTTSITDDQSEQLAKSEDYANMCRLILNAGSKFDLHKRVSVLALELASRFWAADKPIVH